MGVCKGDTRSFDYSTCHFGRNESAYFLHHYGQEPAIFLMPDLAANSVIML